ncbi:Site-specific recombinase XerD [Streptomyces sp. WMMB 714]|uniref:tyrosine-type recombinase/integrase n=1 Tax=Streptomyces sp. WMMB 714 TaxID=1286822 RepID=UPI000823F900|nr:site-specific integrase [Streptomyces sp. WMMB 714]SCK24845.1 Site-specific recombinase XerD [Streptomyces sp. WMMB 714]
MANKSGKRRRFGAVRKLPSGRWQARYPGPDGLMRPADRTFESKADAEVWLSQTEADLTRGDWQDPDAGAVNFETYARQWVVERGLRPTTAELYRRLLRLHLVPFFGTLDVDEITAPRVRTWRTERLAETDAPTTVAKAYRLLKAILETAVDDELIRRNPCRIKGAGQEKAPERPVATVEQVYAIADAMGPRWRLMVLLGAFATLRPEELAELRRGDVDLDAGTLRISLASPELTTGRRVTGEPKSTAGKRTLILPAFIHTDLKRHIEWFAEKETDGLLFVGEKGAPFRRSTFGRKWRKARAKVGLPEGFRFYDLRHTGNTLAADTGAKLKDLMVRMGQSSVRAALIYQHSSLTHQRELADSIDARVRAQRAREGQEPAAKRSGTDLARDA